MKARLEGRVTARFESILFLTLNRNVCLFQKRQEKTSGTLYSVFKEPDPRAAPRTMPYPRHSLGKTVFSRPKFQFPRFLGSRQPFFRLAPLTESASARQEPRKNWDPCGDAQYRSRRTPCQGSSRESGKVNRDGPFPHFSMHKNLCIFQPFFWSSE